MELLVPAYQPYGRCSTTLLPASLKHPRTRGPQSVTVKGLPVKDMLNLASRKFRSGELVMMDGFWV